MDDTAVVSGLVSGNLILLLENDDPELRESGNCLKRGSQSNDAATDNQ